MNHSLLVRPYGGDLIDLMVHPEERDEVRSYANGLPSIRISERTACDLQLLACGAFSPLDHFVGKEEHQRVLEEMRLLDGHVFPVPITLPVNKDSGVHLDQEVALRTTRNEVLGVI